MVLIAMLLATAAAEASPTPVQLADHRGQPMPGCNVSQGTYCNASAPAEERVKNLLSLLTVEEKVGFIAGKAIRRLGVPTLGTGEALHGVNAGCGKDTSTGRSWCPTSFPSALGLGAALNDTLWHAVGSVISTESRAMVRTGGARFTPDINLFRDPRWGRGQEVPGEDPLITSRYATSFVRGLQEDAGADPDHIKVIATCKHFFAYDVDYISDCDANHANCHVRYDRHSFNAVVSKADLADYYLLPWKACAIDGKAGSIMCSYNAVNSTPSCANTAFQNSLLRDKWGWGASRPSQKMSQSVLSPYIVSDCSAIGDMATTNDRCGSRKPSQITAGHNYVNNSQQAAAAAIKGGTDMNCGCVYQNYLADAVGNKTVDLSDIDLAAGRIFFALMRTGLLDAEGRKSPFTNIQQSRINDAAAQQLVLEAAQQSIVLLKNRPPRGSSQNILPLKVGSNDRKLKVSFHGPHATATRAMQSNYCGANTRVLQHSPVLAAKAKWAGKAEITVAPGLNDTVNTTLDMTGINNAAAAAQSADVAVVCVGLSPCGGQFKSGPWYMPTCNEGESHDRNEHLPTEGSLELPGSQQALVEAIAKVQPNYIIVLINGGPLGIDWIQQHSPAVVEAFYPGEVGGDAIIDILDGSYNPTGRLPYTIYPAAFNATRPITDMSLRGGQGITHLHYTGNPLWKFGSGLSYTRFSIAIDSDSTHTAMDTVAGALDDLLAARYYSLRVKNTGGVAGGLNVLGFITCVNSSSIGFPRQRLFGFVGSGSIAPDDTHSVSLSMPTTQQMSVADVEGNQWLHPAAFLVHIGGPPLEAQLVMPLNLQGDTPMLVETFM